MVQWILNAHLYKCMQLQAYYAPIFVANTEHTICIVHFACECALACLRPALGKATQPKHLSKCTKQTTHLKFIRDFAVLFCGADFLISTRFSTDLNIFQPCQPCQQCQPYQLIFLVNIPPRSTHNPTLSCRKKGVSTCPPTLTRTNSATVYMVQMHVTAYQWHMLFTVYVLHVYTYCMLPFLCCQRALWQHVQTLAQRLAKQSIWILLIWSANVTQMSPHDPCILVQLSGHQPPQPFSAGTGSVKHCNTFDSMHKDCMSLCCWLHVEFNQHQAIVIA